MRILCGVLTGFMCWMVLFSIFGVGLVFTVLYGGSALVLLWLAGGQPSSFTTPATNEPVARQRRLRLGMRIAAGVLGVPLGIHTVFLGASFASSMLIEVRAVVSGSSDLSDTIKSIGFVSVWWVLQALAAWVLVRFAFWGRQLPPTRTGLAVLTPSPVPSLAEGEPQDGSVTVTG